MLEEISSGTEEATTKKKLAEAKGEEIGEQSKVIAVEKKDAEDALAEALPALEAARLALDDLDKSDVTEIRYEIMVISLNAFYHLLKLRCKLFCVWIIPFFRSFAKPPKPVQVVCECIVVMKGIKEVSWKSAKGMMSEANFLKSLTEMDVDGITTKQVSTVKGNIEILRKLKHLNKYLINFRAIFYYPISTNSFAKFSRCCHQFVLKHFVCRIFEGTRHDYRGNEREK